MDVTGSNYPEQGGELDGQRTANKPHGATDGSGQRRHVLIVDDDETVREVLRKSLLRDREDRYEFSEAAVVTEAITRLREQLPDCILVDYLLPGENGLKLLQHLQDNPDTRPIAVILITGHGDQSLAVEAMKAGALDYLSKQDLTPDLLQRAVDNALEKVELRRQIILQRRQLQDQNRDLMRAGREAHKDLRRHDRFLAMLSHELRNPLAALLHAAHLLSRCDSLSGDAEQACRVVVRQSAQMSQLLDDLLDVSRVTQGKIQIGKETLDLTSTVDDAVDEIRPGMEQRAQQLSTEIAEGPIWVHGSATRLKQIQANLLSNASKYTPSGETIWLTMHQVDNRAEIRVRDNGEGIPSEMLESIFDLFIQSDNTLDRSEGGMGVGLTLVQALVKLHGGEITAHSDGPGCGSEFVVRLPIADPPFSAAATEQSYAIQSLDSLRIALIEDNPDSREMLAKLLEFDGHQVVTATDGYEGVSLIHSVRPQVAIVDIGLPKLDGYEVAKQVRADTSLDTHLVALTGYGSASDQRAAAEAGFH